MATTVTTYGPGGYDSSKPNNNVVETGAIPTTPEQDNRDAIDAQLGQAIAFFSDAYKNWGTKTAAQKDTDNRNVMRALANVLRLVRGDFSAAD